jgi:matrixin
MVMKHTHTDSRAESARGMKTGARAALATITIAAGLAATLATTARVAFAEDIVLAETARGAVIGHCPTEPLVAPMDMSGNGWDGAGQNAVAVTWRVEGATADMGSDQRTAIINALQVWANVVQISFFETAVANDNVALDFAFATGNHSALEPQEAGDTDCPFDGAGGTLAHAGFPPGVNSLCINPMPETFAGNVHFDDAETWEYDDAAGADNNFSLYLIAVHEIGHALGLTHTTGANDVMRASFGSDEAFAGLSSADITNITSGYAAGVGSVVTINGSGVWVSGSYNGVERGTFNQPFNTIAEGVVGIPPGSAGIVLHMVSGTYTGAPTITQNMVIQPEFGVVTLTQ